MEEKWLKMRVIAFPAAGIAYNESFYAALRRRGTEVVDGIFAGGWLLDNVRKNDVVHVHWPSFLYERHESTAALLAGFVRFLLLLAIVRFRARCVCWTAHNLMPHQRNDLPILDVIARRVVIRLSSRIFVHGPEARRVLCGRFPQAERKCVLIPHGHWIGRYQPEVSRLEARRALSLPDDAFVYLLFGQLNRYKNATGLIQAFRESASGDAVLLLAGRFSDDRYAAEVAAAASGDPRVRVHGRFIPDGEVSTYLSACDAACMPYKDILTSGTAMLAMSFGKPVISINRGFLRDVVTPATGILVEPNDAAGLAGALRQARKVSWNAQEILSHAGRSTFEDAARMFEEAIAM